MAATRSGRTSRSGCSTTPASNAPEDTKKTVLAGVRDALTCTPIWSAPGCPDGPKTSPHAAVRPETERLWRKNSARHARWPTSWLPNLGGDAGEGEALIQQADKLLCESWNERMWSDGEPRLPQGKRRSSRTDHSNSAGGLGGAVWRPPSTWRVSRAIRASRSSILSFLTQNDVGSR